ncbi:hypothetical protein FNV43_RR18706 [Rhamnella rubrinervis]|uniref:DNA-directed RNA polymerases I, II, and III subunit RPABC3 n=1 Tax=Rhamnella rubrinervis TaxID=2594499 RepID=A0A8K0EBE0_9ROSA|nr:hypothetical protein FNV43_RR18706 [Rhamnella rubrinervis]
MPGLLFDDIFTVENLNPNGEKFDKVTRIAAQSEKHGILMHLDVNTEIYPMKEKEKFVMVLTPTLNWNETVGTGDDMQNEQKSLADKFEYIMHGLLYKISEDGSGSDVKVGVYASFGGLQMMLRVDPIHCTKFKVDQKLFLLIRKLP